MTSHSYKFIHMDEALLKSELCQNIIHVMDEAGISKTSLARQTGIPYTTLDRKLKCLSDIGVGETMRIAKALNVETASLLPEAVIATTANKNPQL